MSDKKIALVTGGSRGIGKVCALAIAKAGFFTIVNYVSSEAGAQSVVEEIKSLGGDAVAVKCDISDAESVKLMMDKVVKDYGRLDVLVNNAGITKDGLLIRMSDEDWLKVINTNLNSAFYVTKPAAKIMMKQRSGSIINISSISGVYGNAGQANYSAAKAGLIGFTKAIAKELAPRGVAVNAVAPGFIATDMTHELDTTKIVERIPMGKLGQPQDVANAVVFLATSASYITGQVIGVDGGLVI